MIRYPFGCTTYAAKSAFIKKAIELLRLEYNIMGEWYHPEKSLIVESLHQKLRANVQTRWPYDGNKLDKVEWENYQKERYEKKETILHYEKSILDNEIYKSTRFSPNLDDDIV